VQRATEVGEKRKTSTQHSARVTRRGAHSFKDNGTDRFNENLHNSKSLNKSR